MYFEPIEFESEQDAQAAIRILYPLWCAMYEASEIIPRAERNGR
jgi:hypothetical protein